MQTFTVVLAENDPVMARSLAASLDTHFRCVKVVGSLAELKAALPRVRPDAVVADLETINLTEVANLRREFPTPVICVHRIPDEELWTAALEAGASDVCPKSDSNAVIRALSDMRALSHSTAAA